jgi:pyruvate dehydrogenase E1 component alpha subunit
MILPTDKFNPDTLRAFEARVAEAFNAGRIKAPVHLSGGNELDLLQYFRAFVNPMDYVCTTWRSHYHCLLKGVPEDVLFDDILAGKSITLNYPHNRVISSAIVGGVVPIGLGFAWAIKNTTAHWKDNPEPGIVSEREPRVHVFIGDMTSYSGIVHECRTYARKHLLPIDFVVEDNGVSVCTPTSEVWGEDDAGHTAVLDGKTRYYKYHLDWPHSGAGKRVEF